MRHEGRLPREPPLGRVRGTLLPVVRARDDRGARSGDHVIDRDTLTRTTMQRQWLDRRRSASALDVVTAMVGLQAQEPMEPYVGIWSRRLGFDPAELADALEERAVVRIHLMRRTVHLVTADDAVAFRPVHDPMLRHRTLPFLRRIAPGIDVDELVTAVRAVFGDEPRPLREAARQLDDRFGVGTGRLLADAVVGLVPLVQIPPRGVWGRSGLVVATTLDRWVGGTATPNGDEARQLVLRYLDAFGPAAGADMRAWSGLTGLSTVLAGMADELVTWRDERGRLLLDRRGNELARADPARADEVTVRFLPAFDNVVLGYDDRRRVIDDEHRHLSVAGTRFVLVDGRVAGAWTADRIGVVGNGPGHRRGRTTPTLDGRGDRRDPRRGGRAGPIPR